MYTSVSNESVSNVTLPTKTRLAWFFESWFMVVSGFYELLEYFFAYCTMLIVFDDGASRTKQY